MLLVAAFFAFVLLAVAGGGYLVLRLRTADGVDTAPEEQRERLIGDPEPEVARTSALTGALGALGSLVPLRGKESERLRKELFRAGYRAPSSLAIFSGIRIACAALFSLIALWAGGMVGGGASNALLAAVCGAGFGFLIPPRVIEFLVKARATRIRVAIAPALDLLTLAIEAGQSLDSAMLDTARSLRRVYPDLCAEFLFCHLEMRAGKSRYEALEHLAQRSGEPELAKLAALLIDGERFGTSLGPAIRTHSKYLRTHMRFAAQEQARKLTVKLVLPVFFLIFPSVLLVTLGPAYLQMRKFLDSFLQ